MGPGGGVHPSSCLPSLVLDPRQRASGQLPGTYILASTRRLFPLPTQLCPPPASQESQLGTLVPGGPPESLPPPGQCQAAPTTAPQAQ
jgi:hypothetical protein